MSQNDRITTGEYSNKWTGPRLGPFRPKFPRRCSKPSVFLLHYPSGSAGFLKTPQDPTHCRSRSTLVGVRTSTSIFFFFLFQPKLQARSLGMCFWGSDGCIFGWLFFPVAGSSTRHYSLLTLTSICTANEFFSQAAQTSHTRWAI